jgi:hypothetical protein
MVICPVIQMMLQSPKGGDISESTRKGRVDSDLG